jgi:hypothetical protein
MAGPRERKSATDHPSYFCVVTMLATLGSAVAMMLLAQVVAPANDTVSCQTVSRQEREPKQLRAEPRRTGKERLGRKSSDEQRVDNCKVPLELRGPKPRPDGCVDDASTNSKR